MQWLDHLRAEKIQTIHPNFKLKYRNILPDQNVNFIRWIFLALCPDFMAAMFVT